MVWVCVISLFLQTVVVYALNSSDDSISKETIVENNTSSQSDDSIDISDIYENNVIKIYNTKQLQAIGSNSIVTSTDNDESNYGTGQQISVNDEYITYSPSELMGKKKNKNKEDSKNKQKILSDIIRKMAKKTTDMQSDNKKKKM